MSFHGKYQSEDTTHAAPSLGNISSRQTAAQSAALLPPQHRISLGQWECQYSGVNHFRKYSAATMTVKGQRQPLCELSASRAFASQTPPVMRVLSAAREAESDILLNHGRVIAPRLDAVLRKVAGDEPAQRLEQQ